MSSNRLLLLLVSVLTFVNIGRPASATEALELHAPQLIRQIGDHHWEEGARILLRHPDWPRLEVSIRPWNFDTWSYYLERNPHSTSLDGIDRVTYRNTEEVNRIPNA